SKILAHPIYPLRRRSCAGAFLCRGPKTGTAKHGKNLVLIELAGVVESFGEKIEHGGVVGDDPLDFGCQRSARIAAERHRPHTREIGFATGHLAEPVPTDERTRGGDHEPSPLCFPQSDLNPRSFAAMAATGVADLKTANAIAKRLRDEAVPGFVIGSD